MKKVFILFIALFLGLFSLTSKKAFSKEPAYEKVGPHKVHSLEFPDLKDTGRKNRKVPLKFHYPAKGKNFPLVVFSHGGGGNWNSYIYQVKHLASHGYVVVCTEHIYSSIDRVKYYMSWRGGRLKYIDGLYKITKDPKAMLGRPGDVTFAIDKAILFNKEQYELMGKINTKKIGMMGHSYGAYTTLVICGAQPILDYLKPKVEPGKGLAGDFSDERVTFGLAMSPQPTGGNYFGKESYKTINRPIVGISGSKDTWKTFDDKVMAAEKRWQFWKLLPKGNHYFLWLENADHLSFCDNSKAWILPSKSRPDVQPISKAMMVLFSDYFLKDKQKARNNLNSKYVNSLCGKIVTSVKWNEK